MTDTRNNDTFTEEGFHEALYPQTDRVLHFSGETDKLIPALLTAQKKTERARKDSENPHFKSNYADLETVQSACLPALQEAGILVVQAPSAVEARGIRLTTRLIHAESGQWMQSDLSMFPLKKGPQDYGSAITYSRRYALVSLLCMVQSDDDGNNANARDEERQQKADNRKEGAKKAQKTKAAKRDLPDRIKAMTDAFKKLGLDETWLGRYLGRKPEESSAQEVEAALVVWKELADAKKNDPEGFADRAEALLPQEAR